MKRSILYVLLVGWLLGAVSCVDDEIRPFDDVPKGETTVGMTVEFNPFGEALAAKTRATVGDAVKSINSLCVLVYDVDGNLIKKYPLREGTLEEQYQLAEVERSAEDKETSWSGAKIAEAKTQQAKFKMSLPYGYYRIYAVANMGDMSAYEEDIKTVKGLKAISLNWNEDVAKNNQMLGHFTDANTYTSNDLLKIAEPSMTLRAGIKRMVSKVTLAFDGSNLNEGVFIYIKSVRIMDAPKTCSLGNPNTPTQDEDLIRVEEPGGWDTIRYDLQPEKNIETGEISLVTPPFDDRYLARVTKGRPYFPHDENYGKKFHSETERALFFYENMQGEGKDKRQAKKEDGTLLYEKKDDKPFGTYIEVDAYYNSINQDGVSSGDIKYRFMLGKNITTNYDAERNHHYKLTLKFKHFANDVDWHIDYEEPDPSIEIPDYFISYLYNHRVMVPVQIKTGGRKLLSLKATIDTNSWAPYGVKYLDYYEEMDPFKGGPNRPWNGFLSLRQTNNQIVGDGVGSGDAEKVNKEYYELYNRGNREYEYVEGKSKYEDAVNGDYYLTRSKEDNTVILGQIPMYTRAKLLVKTTGYTGNNPYVAYQRKAIVTFEATLEGLDKPLVGKSVITQVRRVVNPKGIWRKHDGKEPFHVVLKRLPLEQASEFETFPSEGKWKAYQIKGETGFIDLVGATDTEKVKDTIFGQTGTPIDFTVNFLKTCDSDKNNCAIIRVEYHDYSCYHLIFVRQGDAPLAMTNTSKVLWHARNMKTKTAETDCPLEEGSLFKYGNWDQPIDATNNENYYQYGVKVTPVSFKDDSDKDFLIAGTENTAKWDDIGFIKYGDRSNVDRIGCFSNTTVNGRAVSIAMAKDYEELWGSSEIEFGYGVLYGNDGTEVLDKVEQVYGHRRDRHQAGGGGYGMRGIFVYNKNDGRNMFFPIGASGYGHRKNSDGKGKAVLRYSAGRAEQLVNSNLPLLYDLYMRPGAVYWLKREDPLVRWNGYMNTNETKYVIGWDMNYFTFDFNFIDTGNVLHKDKGSDACFVRCVEYE